MEKLKKLVIVLACIVLFLIIAIIIQLNTNNNYKQENTATNQPIVHKKEEKPVENDTESSDDEELEEINQENSVESNTTNENGAIDKENNTNIQEHHQVITTPATRPATSEQQSSTNSSQTIEDQIKGYNDYLGTAGRLYIPSVNINLGLNNANIYNGNSYNAQEIVDREDSAAFYTFGSKLTISDHDYQGFSRIGNLNIYDKAYIKKDSYTVETYELISKFAGQNTGADLIDYSGNSVKRMNGSLIMYTCYGTGNGIMITLWNKVA